MLTPTQIKTAQSTLNILETGEIRRAWLAASNRPDQRATVYRMDAFQRLIDLDYWGLLDLPLVIRGAEISTATLSATPPGCYDGPARNPQPQPDISLAVRA